MRQSSTLLAAFLLGMLSLPLHAQLSSSVWRVGFDVGGNLGEKSTIKPDLRSNMRAYLRYSFLPLFQAEFGGGIGRFASREFDSRIIPFDVRVLFGPTLDDTWNPFLYVGGGITLYHINKPDLDLPAEISRNGVTGSVPVGIGLQLKPLRDENFAFDLSFGYTMMFSDEVNGILEGRNDSYVGGLLGFVYLISDEVGDRDGDGLNDNLELELRTDPDRADTDGDGLSDGEEVDNYKTDPNQVDTDTDGIPDGEEVRTRGTDPLMRER